MERDDIELIQSVLSGDETAFSTLVQKYQKSVHALAWRKIGDFHIAEEITQDTFLQAYKKLGSLKIRTSLPDGSTSLQIGVAKHGFERKNYGHNRLKPRV